MGLRLEDWPQHSNASAARAFFLLRVDLPTPKRPATTSARGWMGDWSRINVLLAQIAQECFCQALGQRIGPRIRVPTPGAPLLSHVDLPKPKCPATTSARGWVAGGFHFSSQNKMHNSSAMNSKHSLPTKSPFLLSDIALWAGY